MVPVLLPNVVLVVVTLGLAAAAASAVWEPLVEWIFVELVAVAYRFEFV